MIVKMKRNSIEKLKDKSSIFSQKRGRELGREGGRENETEGENR